ncbi:MAG: tRNA (adenosine(37)-N6)-threonylcarbamoyltransferase complex dimerization subunit type 1 TsaB [bacterium]|nr:tRNA (adenosine(37)-N6)-threonylcarbamoyltransferase complex dimerization subunit type 1 TsaB [bacterium]
MLLCLDASTEKTMIGLFESPARCEERIITDRDRLAEHVRALLEEHHLKPRALLGIALGSGPGSFTGLRVSYAFAKGFARGTDLKIFPVSSLQVLAANYDGAKSLVAVISPARQKAAHWSVFEKNTLRQISAHEVVTHEEMPGKLTGDVALIGPGLVKLSQELRDSLTNHIPDPPPADWPRAANLGRLALAEWREKTPPDIGLIVPEYGLDFPA